MHRSVRVRRAAGRQVAPVAEPEGNPYSFQVREIKPKRARVKISIVPSVTPERVVLCRDHLHMWNRPALATASTAAARVKDIRRFGRWQWGERDVATIVAWLLYLPTDEAADLIEAFDRAESATSTHAARKRRLHHLRGALRFVAEQFGDSVPHIRPAIRTAA
jgi:hypothetical protein